MRKRSGAKSARRTALKWTKGTRHRQIHTHRRKDCAGYGATFKDDADADDDDKLAEKQHEMKDKPVEEETDLSSGCLGTIVNCTECGCDLVCVCV